MINSIISQFQKARNIREKQRLTPIIQKIAQLGFRDDHVFASIGEDAAAFSTSPENDEYLLLTTDALLPEFIQRSPWGAGFSAIYVGIDDIYACGGIPLACSTTLTYSDPALGDSILQGILDGTRHFRVPLIRGHTTTDSSHISLTSTMIGRVKKAHYLSAKGVIEGDLIALIWDPDGFPAKASRNYWDTITKKSPEEFYRKRTWIKTAIENGWLHSCKDVSNGGLLGTLYQLLVYNEKGAVLDLEQLEGYLQKDEFEYSLHDFLFLFLTSAFLVAVSDKEFNALRVCCEEVAMRAYPLGYIIQPKEIWLEYQTELKTLWNAENNGV